MLREPIAALARTLAALVGTVPAALLGSIAIAVHAPLPRDTRFALGLCLALPLWVTAMCLVFLIRRPVLAWLVCLVLAALLALSIPGLVPGVCPGAMASG